MKSIEIDVIKKMCECNMRISKVAVNMYMHRNTVVYRLERIKEKYGLDPTNFYDLVKLNQLAEIASNEPPELDPLRLCIYCGSEIMNKRRHKFCSDECRKKAYSQKCKRMRRNCTDCNFSVREEGRRVRCIKTGKIVISINGLGHKNMKICPLN